MSYVNRTMIAPAAHAALARTLCAALAGPAGEGMFQTALSADGAEPASHFISAGMIEYEFAVMLPLTTQVNGETVTLAGQPENIYYLAEQAGLDVTYEQIEEMLDAVDVTEGDPHQRMETMGIKLIQPTE